MIVQCIRCKHFGSRGNTAMAKLGYGRCQFEKRSSAFQSATFERSCQQFDPVDTDTADKRQAWLDWEKKRFMKEIGV